MSSISNRFYVTALEDGTTLHGNIASDKSLSQSWNGSAAVPDWTVAANQPTLYITLLSGSTLVVPDNTGKWYYNDHGTSTEITAQDTRFQITTKQITYLGQTATVPALKIIANLASSSNVDVDSIIYKGSYTINESSIGFTAEAQIRITEISKGSNVGVINFVGGVSDITEAGQTITMYGMCYSGETGTDIGGYTTKWYINDDPTPHSGESKTVDGVQYQNAFQVNEAAVVDHATIRCEFYKGGELLDTAYAGVDDMQDPEFMYIQYEGNNGNAASLRTGETAHFQIWVGRRDDPSVLGGTSSPTYNHLKVQLLDGSGDVIIGGSLATGIPASDSEGWRDLSNQISGGKFPLTPHYDTIAANGKNITGILVAWSSPS